MEMPPTGRPRFFPGLQLTRTRTCRRRSASSAGRNGSPGWPSRPFFALFGVQQLAFACLIVLVYPLLIGKRQTAFPGKLVYNEIDMVDVVLGDLERSGTVEGG
jgi:hypothetical protein